MQVSAGTLRHGRHRPPWSWRYLLATQDKGVLGLNSDLCQEQYMLLTAGPSLKFFCPIFRKTKQKGGSRDWTQAVRLTHKHFIHGATLLAQCQQWHIHCSIHFRWPHVLIISSHQVGWSLFTQQGGKYLLCRYLHYLCWGYNCVQKGAATT